MKKGQRKAKPSLTLDPIVYQDLKDASEKTGISTSALVTACCRQRLSGLVKALLSDESESLNLTALPPSLSRESQKHNGG